MKILTLIDQLNQLKAKGYEDVFIDIHDFINVFGEKTPKIDPYQERLYIDGVDQSFKDESEK